MNILLTNDDGIQSEGLLTLAKRLSELCDLWICAPAIQQSGASHSISGGKSFEVIHHDIPGARQAWSVDGKPADCVRVAMSALVSAPVDLIVSGINDVSNYGTDIFYSGTVGAAVEGAMRGLPAFAFSLVYKAGLHSELHWETASRVSCELVGRYILGSLSIEPGSVMNVNIPNLPFDELKGAKSVRLGTQGNASFAHYERIEPQGDESGVSHYRSASVQRVFRDTDPGQDIVAVGDGYVTLTPLLFDRTDYRQLAALGGPGSIFI